MQLNEIAPAKALVGDGLAGDETGLRRFDISYTFPPEVGAGLFEGAGHAYNIRGYEPASGSGLPIYLHTGGVGDTIAINAPELEFARAMARRGYVAALVELPDRLQLRCTGDGLVNSSLHDRARLTYTWNGPGDTTSIGPIATLCRRENADCTAGIALHGLSLGSMLASVAPLYAPVTATLLWSSGARVPGGHTCCGMLNSGGVDASCCDVTSGALLGGEILPCETAEVAGAYLPRSRRRLVLSHHDTMYGDCSCPTITDPAAMVDQSLNECDCGRNKTDSAARQAMLQTGYSCAGTVDDCIQPDGSGYYLPRREEVGGDMDHRFQGHNFHLIAGQFFAPDDPNDLNDAGRVTDPNVPQPPQYSRNYSFNPAFMRTDAPWGFRAGFDWLARAARVALTAGPPHPCLADH